jgi:hypothetical protein
MSDQQQGVTTMEGVTTMANTDTELLMKLRSQQPTAWGHALVNPDGPNAANRIEELALENKRLKLALEAHGT